MKPLLTLFIFCITAFCFSQNLEKEEFVSQTDQTPPPPEPEEPVIEDDSINLVIDTTTIEVPTKYFVTHSEPLPPPPEDNEVYSLADLSKVPTFPVGTFQAYIERNFTYPQELIEDDKIFKGIIYVNFTVEKNGSLTNVKMVKRRGSGYSSIDKQVLDIVKNSPVWTIGINDIGFPVRVDYVQRIRF